MIVVLLQNAALLLGMALVFDLLTATRDVLATRAGKIIAGAAMAGIGVAMIESAVVLQAGVVFDSRSVLLAVSGLFFGIWPTAIAVLITAIYRVHLGGGGALVGVAVIVSSGLIGVCWRRLRHGRLDQISWSDLYALGLVVHAVMLALLFALPSPAARDAVRHLVLPLVVVYPLATLALGKIFAERLRSHRARAEASMLLREAEEGRLRLLRILDEQRATQAELTRAKQLSQSALDALTQHICVVDDQGTIIAVNEAWCSFARRHHARPQTVLAGANYLDVCRRVKGAAAAEAAHFAAGMEDVIAGRSATFAMEYACHAPGEERWFSARITRFSADGAARLVVAHEDVTDRKKAEHERLELLTHLHQAEKLESLGSLAGGVAHDINNVLAAVLSLASGQRRKTPDGEPLAASLDAIVTACLRGRSVVRSLLYFARTDVQSHGPVDLDSVAREIVQLLEQTTLKRIRFETGLHGSLPVVEGDAAAINHAVMNLCVNAIDAMPEGGMIRIATAMRDDGMVQISVRDTGTGMSAEVRERAIEPFFTTKPLGKGTGLGLSMVYGTVKSHRGTIAIESAQGEGTEVTLAFPPGGGHQESLASAPASRTGEADSLRLLLVDDDDLIRDAIASLLELEGHTVHTAEGGAQAVALFAAGLEVDLVILDMNMPVMNGAETLDLLLERRPGQRVLMCSGHGDEEITRLTATRENVLAIQKPFTLDELETRLVAFGLRPAAV